MNKFTREDYMNAAKVSFSYAGMCRYLGLTPRGGNYATLKNKIKDYNIDISHFTGQGWNVGLKYRPMKHYKLSEILQKDFPYDTTKLKKRLVEDGVKKHKCENCGLVKWNGKEIPLELHHINGDRNDNRIENLQLLCPNCHAQTDGYRGKNKTRYEKKESVSDVEIKQLYEQEREKKKSEKIEINKIRKVKPPRYCEVCGKELKRKQSKYCSSKCAHNAVSKRPEEIELVEKIRELKNNITAVGRYYGVSYTAIKKWMKHYKINE
jgi:5-methylcytosine-specific restriction endonuclease McrA/predicted nucleic acid-binding Zn ribbon protein